MVPSVEVVGVYEVEADEPCCLVELIVHDVEGPFDIGTITQEDGAVAASERQVPYAEKLLDVRGDAVVHDFWDGPGNPSIWQGTMRLAFFLHYLDPALPLTTPFGEVPVRQPEPRPARLRHLGYEAP